MRGLSSGMLLAPRRLPLGVGHSAKTRSNHGDAVASSTADDLSGSLRSCRPELQPAPMTPTELEVWQTVQALNRAWTSGRVEELENYFHEDIVAITPTDRQRLEGRTTCIAGWAAFVDQAKILTWKETDPQVRVFGDDAAVVTYYYDLFVEMSGKEMHLAGRDMFLMVNEGGRWLAVADQFSEYPSG